MQALIRKYEGIPGLGKKVAQHRSEIEKTITKAQGFVAFYLLDLPDGSMSITLCRTKEGVDEALRLSTNWLRDNMPELNNKTPKIYQGEVVIDLSGVHAH